MKKLIISLLVMTILLPTLSVSAHGVIDTTEKAPISTKATETRYDARQLHYEIRDGNNNIVSYINGPNGTIRGSGNFGSVVTSTSSFIMDNFTYQDRFALPPSHTLILYPEGTNGFYVPDNKMFMAHVYGTAVPSILMLEVVHNSVNTGFGFADLIPNDGQLSMFLTNTYLYSGQYGTHFKFKVMNISTTTPMTIYRLNFVSYDF